MRISDWGSDVCSSDLLTKTLSRSLWQMLYGQRPSDLTVTQASITWAAISIRMIRPLKPSAYWLQRPAANNKTYWGRQSARSEEHTSELQSLMRTSYAVFCLKKKTSITKEHSIVYTNKL